MGDIERIPQISPTPPLSVRRKPDSGHDSRHQPPKREREVQPDQVELHSDDLPDDSAPQVSDVTIDFNHVDIRT